ncbi:hypothetical protein DFP72DRAFT_1142386 [Ephemerocybe angulata]|uniref:Uncharacterized protein n=1 Tax=Ephemerocybe angulata TaxID=980116 RepID=A0A8H6M1A5_9AGAR|nr:hypothetical protein DFP72DRAFT_1142386 [Tulosesus angulatus]
MKSVAATIGPRGQKGSIATHGRHVLHGTASHDASSKPPNCQLSSFPSTRGGLLRKAAYVPRDYMQQTTILLKACHRMSSENVSLGDSHSELSRCVDLLTDVIDCLIEPPNTASKGEEKESSRGNDSGEEKESLDSREGIVTALRKCKAQVRSTFNIFASSDSASISRGNGADSNIGAEFEAAFAEAEKSDVKANKCVKNISATLREKISRAERVPKWHLEFNAYPPYIPTTIKTREQLEEHVFRWKLCNDDWSLAAVMVFLMKELHKNRKIGRSWTFYYNIPFAKSDFPGGGKKAIAGFDLEMTVGKLANDLVEYYGGRTPWRQAFGNVFKVTDKLIILKAKNGNLLTPEILTKEATTSSRTSSELSIYQIGVDDGSMNFDRSTQSLSGQSTGGSWSYGSTLRSVLSSLGNHVPDLRDISSFLERIIEVQDETEDKYHWTCSDEPPPIPEPHPQFLASPTFQPELSPGPPLEHPAEAPLLPLPVPSFHTPKSVSQDLPTPSTSIIPPPNEESTIVDPSPTPPASMGPSPLSPPPPAIAAGSSLPEPTTPPSAPSEHVAATPLPQPHPPNSLPSSQQITNVQDFGPTARPNLQGTKMRGNNPSGLSSDSNEPTFSVERRAVSYTHHAHANPPPQKLGFFGKMKKKFRG